MGDLVAREWDWRLYPWWPNLAPVLADEHNALAEAYLTLTAERDRYKAAMEVSEVSRMRMDSALTAASSVFRHYEKLHFAKEPPDLDKAQRNRDMALVCENARDLAPTDTKGE